MRESESETESCSDSDVDSDTVVYQEVYKQQKVLEKGIRTDGLSAAHRLDAPALVVCDFNHRWVAAGPGRASWLLLACFTSDTCVHEEQKCQDLKLLN